MPRNSIAAESPVRCFARRIVFAGNQFFPEQTRGESEPTVTHPPNIWTDQGQDTPAEEIPWKDLIDFSR